MWHPEGATSRAWPAHREHHMHRLRQSREPHESCLAVRHEDLPQRTVKCASCCCFLADEDMTPREGIRQAAHVSGLCKIAAESHSEAGMEAVCVTSDQPIGAESRAVKLG